MNINLTVKDLHIHIRGEVFDVKQLLETVSIINSKLDTIMANAQDQFDALMARLNTVTNDIAADYQKLLDEIKNNTVSPASIAAAEANIAKLETLGASVENPVPETGTGETPNP